ncbi:hypothetical protein ACIOWG_09715 [Streptomyces sp. NPDC087658]|uniref:hypothetical protein n=1 Tax=Streptomyces sp. NPDC087658 TaxID=3365800 RepID=UPI00382E94AC
MTRKTSPAPDPQPAPEKDRKAQKAEAKAEQAVAKAEQVTARAAAKAQQTEARAEAKAEQSAARAAAKAEQSESRAAAKAEQSESRAAVKAQKAEAKAEQAAARAAVKAQQSEVKAEQAAVKAAAKAEQSESRAAAKAQQAAARAAAKARRAEARAQAKARRADRRKGRRKIPAARWIVPGAVLAGALAGGAYGILRTPQYTATSYVVIVPTDRADAAAALGFATAYGRVASQVAVVGDAQVWAGVSARTLRASVRTSTSPDAPMISVTATSPRPSTAVNMANGVARSLVVNGNQMQESTNVRVVQFSRAVRPTAPSSPSAPLAALVGGCGGGLLGGLALLIRPKRRPEGIHAPVPGPSTGGSHQAAPNQPGANQVAGHAAPNQPVSAPPQPETV